MPRCIRTSVIAGCPLGIASDILIRKYAVSHKRGRTINPPPRPAQPWGAPVRPEGASAQRAGVPAMPLASVPGSAQGAVLAAGVAVAACRCPQARAAVSRRYRGGQHGEVKGAGSAADKHRKYEDWCSTRARRRTAMPIYRVMFEDNCGSTVSVEVNTTTTEEAIHK
jgi:hypothetical protein